LDTWGGRISDENLVIISDFGSAEQINGHTLRVTSCPTGWHWSGDCCRWSEALVIANRILQNSPNRYGWIYFMHDGAYVRPWTMGAALNVTPSNDTHGTVLGYYGCDTSKCRGGLCQGGGMATNAVALSRLIDDNETDFMQQHIHSCGTCGRWPTLGLTELCREKNITMDVFKGVFPWRLNKACFDHSLLAKKYEPLVFNNVSTWRQMHFLDDLFQGHLEVQKPTTFPWPDERMRCSSYRSVQKCSHDLADVPWMKDWELTEEESKTNCSEPEYDITLASTAVRSV